MIEALIAFGVICGVAILLVARQQTSHHPKKTH